MRRLIFVALAVLAGATLVYGGNAMGQSEDPSSTTVVTTVPPTTEVPTTVPQDCAGDDPCFDCTTMGNHQCDPPPEGPRLLPGWCTTPAGAVVESPDRRCHEVAVEADVDPPVSAEPVTAG